jgi:hypothetical protein
MDGQAAQLRHIILMLSKGATALTRNNSPWMDKPHNLDHSMDEQAAQLRHIILMLSKGATALTRNNSP